MGTALSIATSTPLTVASRYVQWALYSENSDWWKICDQQFIPLIFSTKFKWTSEQEVKYRFKYRILLSSPDSMTGVGFQVSSTYWSKFNEMAYGLWTYLLRRSWLCCLRKKKIHPLDHSCWHDCCSVVVAAVVELEWRGTAWGEGWQVPAPAVSPRRLWTSFCTTGGSWSGSGCIFERGGAGEPFCKASLLSKSKS